MVQYLLTNLEGSCKGELEAYLQLPPEEQASNQEPFSPTCRDEIQNTAMQYQQTMSGGRQQQGQEGQEAAAPEPAEDQGATIASVLVAVLAFFGLPIGYAFYKHQAREQYLKDHPEARAAIERKKAAEAKKDLKSRKRGGVPVPSAE
jgi:hypothetical protein